MSGSTRPGAEPTVSDEALTELKKEITRAIGERAGRSAGKSDERTAQKAPYEPTAEEAKVMLDAVRKRAEGWRGGLAATVGLVLASLAIKPGDGFMKYTGDVRTVLMVLLALSLSSALVGLFLLVKAANGPTWLFELVGPQATADAYLKRVVGARRDLGRGQVAWVLALLLFSVAVAVTWFAGTPPA